MKKMIVNPDNLTPEELESGKKIEVFNFKNTMSLHLYEKLI